jgi:hypothetical protein
MSKKVSKDKTIFFSNKNLIFFLFLYKSLCFVFLTRILIFLCIGKAGQLGKLVFCLSSLI